ncbi:MATE family efflux transporter [Acinetobacter sp. BSP-153]|uniref:MATE family efflux transporter n=1 Tax=Acinetobacter sp. BSP-153 TaxID=3344663 RepID=UPI00376FC7A2
MNIVKDITVPILQLALPLILIQLCQALLGLVNTIVAGRYHYLDLAAIGLGSNIWAPVFILFTGILYVLVPKFSLLKYKEDSQQTAQLYQQGKRVSFLLAMLGFVFIQALAYLCPLFIPDTDVAKICKNYLHLIAFAMPALVYMVFYRFISEGYSQLHPILMSFIIMLICDGLLGYVFVHGIGIFPEMGGMGTGLATIISAYIGCLSMRYWVHKRIPEMSIWTETSTANLSDSIELLKQGMPIGCALVLQVLALATLAFFAARLGTQVIAAHQIVINIAMVIIMIPVAMSSAATIRIAHFNGMKYRKERRWSYYIVTAFTLFYAIVVAGILSQFARQMTAFFSQDSDVVTIAATLMCYVAIFLIFDALQTVAAGILRGMQQFTQPLFVILFCYWMVIIPFSYMFGINGAFQVEPSVMMIWKIMIMGIFLAALLLTAQSYRWVLK